MNARMFCFRHPFDGCDTSQSAMTWSSWTTSKLGYALFQVARSKSLMPIHLRISLLNWISCLALPHKTFAMCRLRAVSSSHRNCADRAALYASIKRGLFPL